MKDLFASDYGELGREYFSMEYLTNPAELMRSAEIYRILRLCGCDLSESGESSSDWELFASFCSVYPMLRGHLVATRIGLLLREQLSLSLPFSKENAADLWREGVERLLSRPRRTASLFDGDVPWLCDGDTLPEKLPAGMSVVLDAVYLTPRSGEELGARRERLREVCARFLKRGCVGVRLRLAAGTSFAEPNPYAIERALTTRRRDGHAEDLLAAQHLREVSAACIECGLPLTVECEGGTEIGALLRYVHRTVGLPPLTVSPKDSSERDALLSLSEETDLRIALRLSDMPTERELATALDSMAARYPIGRVRLITGADLRQSAVAQRETECLLCRFTEKSLEKK